MKKGEAITTNHVRRIRPGFGIAPKYFDQIVGKIVSQDVERGTAVDWSLIDV